MSPSTRRAWIEISKRPSNTKYRPAVALHPEGVDRNPTLNGFAAEAKGVALHPEGVDRNPYYLSIGMTEEQSPSTRRAWIEIVSTESRVRWTAVALHPEGVDRNPGRHVRRKSERLMSPSTRRAWIEI